MDRFNWGGKLTGYSVWTVLLGKYVCEGGFDMMATRSLASIGLRSRAM